MNPVTQQWEALIAEPPWGMVRYRPLLRTCAAHPVVSRYWPVFSMTILCLSRCMRYPFTDDCPVLCAPVGEDDLCEIRERDGERVVARGAPEQVVGILADLLPPLNGFAFEGNAEEMRQATDQ